MKIRRFLYTFSFNWTWLIPLPLAYIIADTFAYINYLFAKKECDAMRSNFRTIFPEKTPRQINALVRGCYRNFGRNLAELFRIHRRDKEAVAIRSDFEQMKKISKGLDKGNGVIIATGHFCNWELSAALITKVSGTLHSIALPDPDPAIDRFYNRARNAIDNNTLILSNASRQTLRLLKNNNTIAILSDRSYTGEGIKIDFFGKPALFPTGIAQFSIKAKSAVYPYFMIRTGIGRYKTLVADQIVIPEEGSKDEKIKAVLTQYVTFLEETIKEYPTFWFAHYPFWDGKPPGSLEQD